MPYDHLIHNALLLTLEPDDLPFPNGYVAVQDGKIAALGQAADVSQLPAARQRLDNRRTGR